MKVSVSEKYSFKIKKVFFSKNLNFKIPRKVKKKIKYLNSHIFVKDLKFPKSKFSKSVVSLDTRYKGRIFFSDMFLVSRKDIKRVSVLIGDLSRSYKPDVLLTLKLPKKNKFIETYEGFYY